MTLKLTVLFLMGTFLFTAQANSLCIAHRGYSAKFLENSMEAFEQAIFFGADGVEFDIHHTKDGVPVVVHDEDLSRVVFNDTQCPVDEKIDSLYFEQLSSCRLKNGERIPTLEFVMENLWDQGDFYIFIDMKDRPSREFFQVLSAYKDFSRMRFISFEKNYLDEISSYFPQSRTMLLSHFWPRGIRFQGINLNYRSRWALRVYNLFGKETGLWTINSRKRLRRSFRQNIDFITTDFVSRCLNIQKSL